MELYFPDNDYLDTVKKKVERSLRYSAVLASSIFNFDVTTEIAVEDGSIRANATVFALLNMMLVGIERYGEIRHGVEQLYADTQMFGKAIITYVEKGLFGEDNPAFEKFVQSGIPGELKKIGDEMAFLARHVDDIDPKEMKSRLIGLQVHIDTLLTAFGKEDVQRLGTVLSEVCDRYARDSSGGRVPLFPSSRSPIAASRKELEAFLHQLRSRFRSD